MRHPFWHVRIRQRQQLNAAIRLALGFYLPYGKTLVLRHILSEELYLFDSDIKIAPFKIIEILSSYSFLLKLSLTHV